MAAKQMKRHRCTVCEYVYDPKRGEPKNDIKLGTAFEDLPSSYVCPVCGVYVKIGKSAFLPIE